MSAFNPIKKHKASHDQNYRHQSLIHKNFPCQFKITEIVTKIKDADQRWVNWVD